MSRDFKGKGPSENQRRWESSPFTEARAWIVKLLAEGDVEGVKEILESIGSRNDLSGFAFKNKVPSKYPPYYSYEMPWLKCQNGKFNGFDFSEADFTATAWEDCEFNKCIFKKGIWNSTYFGGCVIKDCLFEGCHFNGVALGHSTKRNLGQISDTIFRKGKFLHVSFDYPTIGNCRFECDILGTDFHGSHLKNCSFSGTLKDVTFNGNIKPDRQQLERLPNLPQPVNQMINIDFSEADMDSVEFHYWVDLSLCRFPKDVIYLSDAKGTLKAALSEIEFWEDGLEKQFGLFVIRYEYDYLIRRNDQEQWAIGLNALEKQYKRLYKYDSELPVEKITSLLRKHDV